MAVNGGRASEFEAAEALKVQANAAFQACKFGNAVKLYSEAIQANSNNPVYWANRAFAHTKLEEYGSAIRDATKALELDPKYVKGYYRRGAAYMALGKFKDGLKDFRQVCKIVPRDPDAMKKLKECERAVHRSKFEDAISSEEPQQSIVESIRLNLIEVHHSYTGARISDSGLDLAFILHMIKDFKDQKQLHRRYAFQILLQMREILYSLPTLVDINVPDGRHFTVCGDIHGQFYDLLNIFELNGLPSNDNPYLFNGDFVDRGSFSVEVILTLFAFKCLYPSGLHLARGNHESHGMNKIYGFEGEVKAKFTDTMASLFREVFCGLPLAHVINHRILVVHGGLFSKDFVRLSDISEVDRFREPPDEGLMCEILWSDPQPEPGRAPSKRGVGVSFGPDVSQKFLQQNNLDLLVRSHEVKDPGYEEGHNGKVITVFSAPNYCDQMGNKGAFVRFEAPALKPMFTTYDAVPHPQVKPMAYAMNFAGLL